MAYKNKKFPSKSQKTTKTSGTGYGKGSMLVRQKAAQRSQRKYK
jgi:hypothetical protein